MWCDSKDGSVPMETVVVKELVPRVDASFRTFAAREGRLIEGFSLGGYGAARLGFKFPEVFGADSILAGGPLDLEFQGPRAKGNPDLGEHILETVFGADLGCFKAQSPWMLAAQNADGIRGKSLVRQAVGDRDFTADLNRAFAARLKKLNIPHTFTVLPTIEHNAVGLLRGLGEVNWEFYRAAFAAAH
jgi:S-formylglutathione hydrolase FrmB